MRPAVLRAYQILQVAPWAGRDEVRHAYWSRAKLAHPDLQRPADRMVELNRAVQIVRAR